MLDRQWTEFVFDICILLGSNGFGWLLHCLPFDLDPKTTDDVFSSAGPEAYVEVQQFLHQARPAVQPCRLDVHPQQCWGCTQCL